MPIRISPHRGEERKHFVARCVKNKHVQLAAKHRSKTNKKQISIALGIRYGLWRSKKT